jgi:membrane protease YdiL (CAAX protease family)
MSLTEGAATGFEICLILCGAWLIWRKVLSPAAKAAFKMRLSEWRLLKIDFACFLCFAFVGATGLSAAAGFLLRNSHLGPDAMAVAGGAVMHLGVLLGLAGFFLMYGFRAQLGGAVAFALPELRSGLATFLVALPLVDGASFAWEYLLGKAGLPVEKQDMVDILENTDSGVIKLSLVAVAVLLVPVTEEILFRAGLFRYFRTRAPRWAAILLSSLLFGALHVSWGDHFVGLPSLAPLTVLAVVFCLAYERTGSIGTTIVAHALFNLNTFVLVVAGAGS